CHQCSLGLNSVAASQHEDILLEVPFHMSKGMLGSGLPSGINLFGSLILSFKSLLEIFEHQAHDPPTILIRGAFTIMNTTMTKSWLADPIVLLATLWVGELIGKLVLLGTKVTIFLFVVAKMALAKRLLLFIMRSLALRGNHHLNAFVIDLFELCGVRIPLIRARHLTELLQFLVGLFNLLG